MEYKAIEAIPGWYSIAKKAGELYGTLDAYEKVPMYYRAINLRADALGTVPYELLRAGLPVDYPFSTPLENLIQQTERALMLVGRAFWLRLYRGRVLYGFQFINPRSVEVTFHPEMMSGADYLTGLRFTQKIDGQVHATWTAADIVYFHEPSIKNDINEEVSPARVALQSAQLAYYLERFASAFFEHGAQPALVLSLDKSITPPELERMKSHWTRYVENVGNAFKTFFFRGQVNAQIVTFPLDQMDMVPIQERAVMNIVSTFGVPRTMIEASAANYATADSDRQSFWRETIVPRLAFYERVLNEQLFRTLKYQFKFLPEKLDVFQVDEAARANSLVLLVQAGLPLAAAMKQLGYDNIEEALGLPAVIQQDTDGGVNVDTGTPVSTPAPAMPDERTALADTAQKRAQELERYQTKALARYKPGKLAAVKFSSDVLPQYMLDYIDTELSDVKKKYEIVALFDSLKLTYADMTPGEQKVYKSIVKKLEKRNIDVSQKIAAGDYSGIDTDLLNILDASVADTVLDAGAERVQPIRGMADEQSAALVEQGIKAHGATYLDKYWNPFLTDLSATEKTYVDKVIANTMVTPGTTATDIMQQLSMFGQLRASRIAFTEPTRAASQQTMQVRDLAQSNGISVVRIWNTEKDRKVCDICIALDGLTDDLWASVYTGDQDISQGAPAHVNCRCDTGLEYVDSITQPAETPAEELTTDDALGIAENTDKEERIQTARQIIANSYITAEQSEQRALDINQRFEEIGNAARTASTFEKTVYRQELTQLQKELDALPVYRSNAYYDQILIALKSDNPQEIEIAKITGADRLFGGKVKLSKEDKATIEKYVKATAAIVDKQGESFLVNVLVTDGGGVYYDATSNTIAIPVTLKVGYIMHETLHALQQNVGLGVAQTEAFAVNAIGNEAPGTPYINQGNEVIWYADDVPSKYTLRQYPNSVMNGQKAEFAEVLTTALDVADFDMQTDPRHKKITDLFTSIIRS